MQIFKKLPDLFCILFPIISGYATVYFCPIKKNSANNVKFRPPAFVFAIVWPILYLMLGYAWLISKKYSLIYFLLTISLCFWIIVYACQKNKKLAIFLLLFSIFLAFTCYTLSLKFSKLLLLPLIVWLNFALLLNVFEVSSIR